MAVKSIGSQQDFKKIPVLGLVPESRSTAPASPVGGQLYVDTTANRIFVFEGSAWVLMSQTGAELLSRKGAASGYAGLDSSSLVPIGQLPATNTGTASATQVVRGDHSALSDQRVPTDGSVTGGATGSGVKIAVGTITDVNVAAANKDGVAGTPSLRSLGLGATQALAGTTRLDQITAPTGVVSFSSQELTNLGAPTAPTSAARLSDVQAAQAGIDAKPSARAATTANITLTGTQTIDGVAVAAGDRVLVKNQTTASANGIYVAASGAWARSSDVITANTFLFVEEGTAAADTSWVVTTNGAITAGTTALTWAQFGAAQYYTAGNGLNLAGNAFSVVADPVAGNPVAVGPSGVRLTTIPISGGGTGATTAAAARTNLGALTKYAADLGALGAGTEVNIVHNLGTTDVVPSFRTPLDGNYVELAWRVVDANTLAVQADVAYAAATVRAVVFG